MTTPGDFPGTILCIAEPVSITGTVFRHMLLLSISGVQILHSTHSGWSFIICRKAGEAYTMVWLAACGLLSESLRANRTRSQHILKRARDSAGTL